MSKICSHLSIDSLTMGEARRWAELAAGLMIKSCKDPNMVFAWNDPKCREYVTEYMVSISGAWFPDDWSMEKITNPTTFDWQKVAVSTYICLLNYAKNIPEMSDQLNIIEDSLKVLSTIV